MCATVILKYITLELNEHSYYFPEQFYQSLYVETNLVYESWGYQDSKRYYGICGYDAVQFARQEPTLPKKLLPPW
jgi:hypothetical protein